MKKPSIVVDTNVPLAADGKAGQADAACALRCMDELEATMRSRRVILDNARLILDEYLAQRPHGFPRGPGDAFLVWINDNQANPAHVRIVPILPRDSDSRGFEEFPSDPALATFDRNDRKFVAAALASEDHPPILNATDNDWCEHREALERNNVHVSFLCPQLMRDPGCV